MYIILCTYQVPGIVYQVHILISLVRRLVYIVLEGLWSTIYIHPRESICISSAVPPVRVVGQTAAESQVVVPYYTESHQVVVLLLLFV